ncbi:SNF2 family N-terminal domain-containing protein [Xylariomycetidae sp. FL2044]|nr:SNF2 family N-terminal domain-containing protein [Xylariomycetidae sp. FL2044]
MDHTRIKREPLQNLPSMCYPNVLVNLFYSFSLILRLDLPLAGNDQTPSTPIRARRASHLADVDPFDPFDPFDPSDQENLQSPSSDGQGARPIKTERVDAQVANRFRALLHEQELRKKEKEISSRFRDRADVNEQRAIQDQLNVHQDSTTSTPRRGVKAEASASGPHAHQFPPPSQRRVCFSCCSPQVDRECGSCKKATYCSRNCQRQDWSRHAPLCRQNKTDVGPKYLNAKREQPDIKPVPQHVQGRPVAPIPVIKRDPDHMAVSSTAPIAEDPSDGDASQLSMAAFNSREQAQRAIDHEVAKNLFDLPPVEIPPEQRQPTPGAMTCKLLPHQRVGLTWLMKQEASTRKGSILADTPGLGKTIEALALMLARPPQDPARKTTLIVAPTAVLSQWEQEIHDKVKPGFRLKTKIYHGMKKRDMTVSKLLSYDVVLTTYGTLAWERESWYTKKRQWKPILLASNTYFHRIILDEAHHVKNRNSSRSQAVSMLKGTYRLAMTGTPLMNNAGEIFSLIRFLDISPYNEWRHYQRDFDGPIRRKNEGDRREAIRKLQIVIRSIVLRRTSNDKIDGKQILNLPEMSQEDVPAEFDEDQMIFYIFPRRLDLGPKK